MYVSVNLKHNLKFRSLSESLFRVDADADVHVNGEYFDFAARNHNLFINMEIACTCE